MTKSYVGMGTAACPVCLTRHSEAVLIDQRLKDTLTKDEFMGWEMCPEHEKLRSDGYIALTVCKNQPTGPADADRTGDIVHIRSEAWPKIFNVPVPPKALCFIEVDTFEMLKEMQSE